MSRVELKLSEKVVAEVVSLSRVFLGKNNSLGIRISSKAVSVKVKTADGEIAKKAMTPIALFTFENGEVEICKLYAEQMETYPSKETLITISASDFFTAVGAFANISGGVTLEVDEEQQVVWLFSQGGGIRLKVAMRQPIQFSKANPKDYVEITVDANQFRRAGNALNGMRTGMSYDGNKLMLFGCNPGVNQFVKVLIDPKAASGKGTLQENPKMEIAVTDAALSKICSFFKGSEITLYLTKEKLIVRDRLAWYECQTLASARVSSTMIASVEKLNEAPVCLCVVKHDELMQALIPMKAATAIIKNQQSGAVYLYMNYTDNTVTLTLKDGSQVFFSPSILQNNEADFKVAVDLELFERTIGKLGSTSHLAVNFSYTPDGGGAVIGMQPIIPDKDGNPVYDESLTAYCASIGYKEAYKDNKSEEVEVKSEEESGK